MLFFIFYREGGGGGGRGTHSPTKNMISIFSLSRDDKSYYIIFNGLMKGLFYNSNKCMA